MQGTVAAARPAPTLFAGAAALRERTAARTRELLATRRGGVYELVEYHLGWRDEENSAANEGDREEKVAGHVRDLRCCKA